MGRVHGIETGYLNIVRVTLAIAVVLGVLAVGGGILWYALVHMTTSGTHYPTDYFESPDWESIRHRVLPTFSEQRGPDKAPSVRDEERGQSRQPIDERITRIADNLNAQFSRNAGDETGFTDRYPRRLLEAWVFDESEISGTYLAEYTNRLIAVSETIGKDQQINRIGSIDDRARVIMEALDAFRLAYLARLQQAESRAAGANSAATAKRVEAAHRSIYLGLGGLGLLVSLVLIVVLLRIEVHLRNQVHLQTLARAGGRNADVSGQVEG